MPILNRTAVGEVGEYPKAPLEVHDYEVLLETLVPIPEGKQFAEKVRAEIENNVYVNMAANHSQSGNEKDLVSSRFREHDEIGFV